MQIGKFFDVPCPACGHINPRIEGIPNTTFEDDFLCGKCGRKMKKPKDGKLPTKTED